MSTHACTLQPALMTEGDSSSPPWGSISHNALGNFQITLLENLLFVTQIFVYATFHHQYVILKKIKNKYRKIKNSSAAELCQKSRFSIFIKAAILIFPKTQILTINSRLLYTFFIIFHISITIQSNRMRQLLQQFSFCLRHKYCQFFCSSKMYL